jgi:imidazoleglycerol phosphate synthase glutamine amidotransferase subunit HisH
VQVGEFDTAKGLPVPHIGWNTLQQLRSSDLLAAVAPTDRVYFVHSFRWEGVCAGGRVGWNRGGELQILWQTQGWRW